MCTADNKPHDAALYIISVVDFRLCFMFYCSMSTMLKLRIFDKVTISHIATLQRGITLSLRSLKNGQRYVLHLAYILD